MVGQHWQWLKFAVILAIGACGSPLPADNPNLTQPAPMAANASPTSDTGSFLLSQTWRGVHLLKDPAQPGASLTANEVELAFYDNATFLLTHAGDNNSFVQGSYQSSPNTLTFAVDQATSQALGQQGQSQVLTYIRNGTSLRLFNHRYEFSLTGEQSQGVAANKDEPDPKEAQTLFDSWTCPSQQRPWRINIFPNKTYLVRTYTADQASQLVTAKGVLVAYEETPTPHASLSFALGKQTWGLTITRIASDLLRSEVKIYSGEPDRGSPQQTLTCIRL